MHAEAVHKKDDGLPGFAFRIQAEKLPARGQLQADRVADDKVRRDFRGPALFPFVVLRRGAGREKKNNEQKPHFFRATQYKGMPAAMTSKPASTRLPNFGP